MAPSPTPPPSMADQHSTETFERWRPFWIGITDNFTQHFASVESSREWRAHLMGSKPEGEQLRRALTQKFSSTTMMLSVILAVEIGILTSPAQPADDVRRAFKEQEFNSLEYWAGVALGWSIFVSIGAVIANYTAWGMFTAISDANLRMIARSQIGVHCAQLPSFLILITLYMFIISVILFWFVIAPLYAAIGLSVALVICLIYIISTYSALGSLVMYSGALSTDRIIVNDTVQEGMNGLQISDELMRMKLKRMKSGFSVSEQYADIKMRNVRHAKAQSMQELLSCSTHHRSRNGSLGPSLSTGASLDGGGNFRARALLEKSSKHERTYTSHRKVPSVDRDSSLDMSLGSIRSFGSLSSYASFGVLESIDDDSHGDDTDDDDDDNAKEQPPRESARQPPEDIIKEHKD